MNGIDPSVKPPIFIVGVPRSGTTLLAALVSGHSTIACGPETFFFDQTSASARTGAVNDTSWPDKAVALLAGLHLEGQRVLDAFGLTDEQVRGYLANRSPSESALLEGLTALHAHTLDKTRWAEKTPHHLLHVSTIQAVYPQARILWIVRDPRDASRSMTKIPAFSDDPLSNAFRWVQWEALGRGVADDPHVFTVQYESLVKTPEPVLRRICSFIDAPFEPAMLDPTAQADQLVTDKEPWKEQVRRPIDPSNAFKWRQTMDPEMAHAISLVCHEDMERHGYSQPKRPSVTLEAYGLNARTADRVPALRDLTQAEVYLKPMNLQRGEVSAGQGFDLCVVFPFELGSRRTERIRTALWFCGYVLGQWLRGRRVYYAEIGEPWGPAQRMCQVVLRQVGTSWQHLVSRYCPVASEG